MGKINYNDISKIYDDVRDEEMTIINSFLDEVKISEATKILDVGCGTGNYTNILQKITKAEVYGVDASEGMLEKAKEKNQHIILKVGLATDIPFEDCIFDFVYMTDVIHHIKDIDKMFLEFYRVLKNGGKVCISTQSHRQIDLRYMSEFFPSTAIVDKQRYPDIEEIISSAKKNGFSFLKIEIISEGEEVELGNKFLELLEKKGYSMLHLISDEDYQIGLNRVKSEMKNGLIKRKSAGGTLVWLIKNEKM
ncbi:class I SAM-dependent methyltransferase [Caloranaerobacter ferrireducens]|uniref:class I SAM-dependent methyltransferase n=1 Tax=Caloranaerobacter ferrireducens TaxID=1323370 RepID=UPI00084DEE63|nr:class I SAM-dependent methyltransferase [Caloranaerobacter ferrireducens]